MHEYVGMTIKEHEGGLFIHQPDIIKEMEGKFWDKVVKNMKVYDTPTGTQDKIMRPEKDAKLLSHEQQQDFRSGVGSLLYLVKHRT
jgi:hypothetical protein